MSRRKQPPATKILRRKQYDQLRALTAWYAATPDDLDLPDSVDEAVMLREAELVPDSILPRDWSLVSVQIEDEDTARANSTLVGALVALVAPDNGQYTTETAVILLRGVK